MYPKKLNRCGGLIVATALVIGCTSFAHAEVLDLQSALELGLKNPRGEYVRAQETLQDSRWNFQLTNIGRGYKHSFSVNASETQSFWDDREYSSSYGGSLSSEISRPGIFGGTFSNSIGTDYTRSSGSSASRTMSPKVSFGWKQPLSLNAIDYKEYEKDADIRTLTDAQLSSMVTKKSAVNSVISDYIGLYQAQRKIQLERDQHAFFLRFYEADIEQVKLGMKSELDQLELHAQLLENKFNIKTSTQSLKEQQEKFNVSLDIPETSEFELIMLKQPSYELPATFDAEAVAEHTIENQLAKRSVETAKMAFGSLDNEFAAQADLSADWSGGVDATDWKTTSSSGTVGGSISIPVFYGEEYKIKKNQLQVAFEKAVEDYDLQLKNRKIEYANLYIACKQADQNLEIMRERFGIQQKLVKVAEVKYKSGSISLKELIEAHNTFTSIKLQYENQQLSRFTTYSKFIMETEGLEYWFGLMEIPSIK